MNEGREVQVIDVTRRSVESGESRGSSFEFEVRDDGWRDERGTLFFCEMRTLRYSLTV